MGLLCEMRWWSLSIPSWWTPALQNPAAHLSLLAPGKAKLRLGEGVGLLYYPSNKLKCAVGTAHNKDAAEPHQ